MKKQFFLVLLCIFICGINACAKSGKQEAKPEIKQQTEKRLTQDYPGYLKDYLIEGISYYQDPRTKICFAHNSRNSGFSYVPCEMVPPDLLTKKY
ncbi:MAG: hypothetical protein WCX17_02075 [Parcubacteria group bacterium]|jgi:hypothetical protein